MASIATLRRRRAGARARQPKNALTRPYADFPPLDWEDTRTQLSGGLASPGADTFRSVHTCKYACTGPRIVLGNHRLRVQDGEEYNIPPITVAAGLEYPIGTYLGPCTFGGSTHVVLGAGELWEADSRYPGVSIPAGASYAVRIWADAASHGGADLPVNRAIPQGVPSGQTNDGVNHTALGDTAAYSGVSPYLFTHLALTADSVPGAWWVAILGDSVAAEQLGTGGRGFLANRVAALGYQSAFMPYAGEGLVNFWTNRSGTASPIAPNIGSPVRCLLASNCDVVVEGYGTDDLRDRQDVGLWEAVVANVAGSIRHAGARVSKYWKCTLTPATSSTDSWETLANQSDFDPARPGVPVSGQDRRRQMNAWLAGDLGPIGITGTLDTGDAAASSPGADTWLVNGTANFATGDGTHPTSSALDLMSAAIPAAALSPTPSPCHRPHRMILRPRPRLRGR